MATARQVTVVKDNSKEVLAAVKALASKRVLVGIPKDAGQRQGTGPSNALIGYVQETGDPATNLPARPFLVPGVKEAQSRISAGFRRAAKLALEGQIARVDDQLNAVGMIAADAARKKIDEGLSPPLAAATVRGRLRRTQRGQRMLRGLKAKGVDIVEWGATNLKPLIDTGQLRRAITYVIRKR